MAIDAAPHRQAIVVRMFQAIDGCEWDRLPEQFADGYELSAGRIRHRKTVFFRPAI